MKLNSFVNQYKKTHTRGDGLLLGLPGHCGAAGLRPRWDAALGDSSTEVLLPGFQFPNKGWKLCPLKWKRQVSKSLIQISCSGCWKSKFKVTDLVSSEAPLLGCQLVASSMGFYMDFSLCESPWCLSLCFNHLFLYRYQSDWLRAHTNDPILTY